jgi:uncharacterized membrane protein YphA (DoxX/SURF4 family)
MAANRQAGGLALLRIVIGVFLVCMGLTKVSWLLDHRPLVAELQEWLGTASSLNRWYLETVCLPGAAVFARVVVLAELIGGAALILGAWTRLVAALFLLMILNFHFASGQLFQYGYLTNGYGLPVLGSLLALAVGGARLPLSVRT